MNKRILRINAEIQKALGEIFTFELQNPKITGIISVVEVDTTNDLESCKIYLSIFSPENDTLDIFNEIKHSGTFIRRELAKRISLRKMPYLFFFLDKSNDEIAKINDLINEIKTSEKVLDDEN